MFGHYRLDHRLGMGGGGEVWRAYDTELERTVALKTMSPDLLARPDAAERFRREAKLAAGLDHPHIVRVHTIGEIDRRLYIDMQLVDGGSVADLLTRTGALDPAQVTAIVAAVAAALDHAHGVDGRPGQRMIHRDVKPGNILVARHRHGRGHGHVYLADFGVARPVDTDSGLTASGAVIGTPAYLAPELWNGLRPGRGSRPDLRIDVYALAVTTFEMLVGRRPFPGPEWPALMHDHLNTPVPRVTPVRPGVPAAVDEVVARGMAKDPDRRYPSAGAFADDLRAALVPPSSTGAPGVPGAAAGSTHRVAPPPTPTKTLPAPDGDAEPGVAERGDGVDADAPPSGDPGPLGAAAAPRPSGHAVWAYAGTTAHFAGSGLAALAVPLYLLDVVPGGWRLLAVAVLLYALGVVVTVFVAAGRS